ncbi:MAG TPA: NBR1-Ig-like domain-containing protein, partial [Anaerolineales bacterium]|nr:NBR1-Ig-like domain-containing protein [Anaerolineales bacterium]
MKFTITPTHRTWLASLVFLALLSAACTRSVAPSDAEIAAAASQAAIDTEDAGIQLTLEALLGSATVQSAVTATPSATSTVAATATPESAQLTELAATLTAQVDGEVTPEGEEPTETPTPDATVTACYGARYVYDESYPDGTRVDPGQAMAKTWRLQNVGTCNWVSGQYELVFVAG